MTLILFCMLSPPLVCSICGGFGEEYFGGVIGTMVGLLAVTSIFWSMDRLVKADNLETHQRPHPEALLHFRNTATEWQKLWLASGFLFAVFGPLFLGSILGAYGHGIMLIVSGATITCTMLHGLQQFHVADVRQAT